MAFPELVVRLRMRRASRVMIAATSSCLFALACSKSPDGYMAGPTFATTVTLNTKDTAVKVGEEVLLSASRKTEGWVEASESENRPDKCFLRAVPANESEVAANLSWDVSPKGHAKFDVPRTPTKIRYVTFDRPGQYRLKGKSALYCEGAWSNEITITVRE